MRRNARTHSRGAALERALRDAFHRDVLAQQHSGEIEVVSCAIRADRRAARDSEPKIHQNDTAAKDGNDKNERDHGAAIRQPALETHPREPTTLPSAHEVRETCRA